MAGRKKLSDEAREEAIKLRKKGLSYVAIAERYGVDYRTIYRICEPEKYTQEKIKNRQYNKNCSKAILNTRKENQRLFRLSLTRSTDGDIIEHLESKDNMSDYLRMLIRKDMDNTKSCPKDS